MCLLCAVCVGTQVCVFMEEETRSHIQSEVMETHMLMGEKNISDPALVNVFFFLIQFVPLY